jgi:hypothetical protein
LEFLNVEALGGVHKVGCTSSPPSCNVLVKCTELQVASETSSMT